MRPNMSLNGLVSDSISSKKYDGSTRLYVTVLSTCTQMYRVGEKSLYTYTARTHNHTAQQLLLPFNIPQWSWHRNDHQTLVCHTQHCETTLKKDLKMRLCCPVFMNKLLDVDMDQRCDSCHTLVDKYPSVRCCAKVFFQWLMCHLLQCMCQKCCVLVKAISISYRRWNMLHHMWWYRQV